MAASRMMARITTTTQKKNTMMPGMAYPATVLALATAASYPPPPGLFNIGRPGRGGTSPLNRVDTRSVRVGYAGGTWMGIFSRKPREPSAGRPSVTRQVAFADQLKAQALQLQAQAMEQAAVFSRASGADPVPAAGSMSWARQVMAILAPPGP